MANFRDKLETKFSDNLRFQLDSRAMTPYELSLYSDVSKSYIYKLLSNENCNPSIQCLERLAETIGCSVEDLIG